jgi:hypothetical protein
VILVENSKNIMPHRASVKPLQKTPIHQNQHIKNIHLLDKISQLFDKNLLRLLYFMYNVQTTILFYWGIDGKIL